MFGPNDPARRRFLASLTGAAAASLLQSSPAGAAGQPSPPQFLRTSKRPLTASDFTYLGCFRCPPFAFWPSNALGGDQAANTAYSYYSLGSAPLASRVVNGERRFFIVGHGNSGNQVIEIALPSSLGQDPATAPIAETRDYWNGPGGGVYGPNSVRKFSRNWPKGGGEVKTTGLLWDEERQVLWWAIGEVFQTQATGSPVLGYAKLTTPTGSPTTPASATAYGPWDLAPTISNHTAKGMIVELPAALRPLVGNRRLGMGGAHFHSILGPHDFGPAVIGVDEPTDSSVPMSPSGGYPWNANRRVLDHVNVLRYGNGAPGGIDSHGSYEYLRRARRPPDYSLLGINEPFPAAGAGGTTVNPQNGVGWWTHTDVTHGAVFVDTGTRQGMVFTGGVSSGRTWYTTSGYVPHDWRPGDPRFGEAVPAMFDLGERLRIGSEFYHPAFYLLSLDDLVTGATRGYGHYQQDVAIVRHAKQAPDSTREGGRAWPFGAPVYDRESRRLFVIQAPGWREGTEYKPLIHCWQVAD